MIFDKLFRNSNGDYVDIFSVFLGENNSKDYIYTMAEAHAINLIAKTIAKTELQVYAKKDKNIEKTKDILYWSLNLQPNYNEKGTMFWYKFVTKLLVDKKALIIINQKFDGTNLFYVADSFKTDESILYGKQFTQITLTDGEGNKLSLGKKYNKDNSIYYSIQNSYLEKSCESFKVNSSKLINTITKKYIKSNSSKWKLKKPGSQLPLKDIQTGKEISYDEFIKKITEGLQNEEDATILLSDMFELVNLNKDNSQSLSDYKDMIKIIGDEVANRYDIPLDIFYGSKTEKSTANNDFITFAVDPYYKLIEDGLNVALVGRKSFIDGEIIKYNKNSIQYRDILESANGIDKLTADGFSRNEINELLGLPKINELWADQHHITKNYDTVGGGEDGDGK